MTTEFKAGSPFVAEQPGSIGAGADIYRKLDRRPRRSKMMYAAPIIAGAIVLAGGAYMLLKPSGAPLSASPPAPQGLQTAPLAAPPAQPARMAAAPLPETQSLPAEPAPIAHHATRPAHLTAQRVRPRRGAAQRRDQRRGRQRLCASHSRRSPVGGAAGRDICRAAVGRFKRSCAGHIAAAARAAAILRFRTGSRPPINEMGIGGV